MEDAARHLPKMTFQVRGLEAKGKMFPKISLVSGQETKEKDSRKPKARGETSRLPRRGRPPPGTIPSLAPVRLSVEATLNTGGIRSVRAHHCKGQSWRRKKQDWVF